MKTNGLMGTGRMGLLGMVLTVVASRPAPSQEATLSVDRPLSPIGVAGTKLAEVIDQLDVEHRWQAGQGVDWRTGLPKGGESKLATHAGAFVAAACDHIGVALLHPPEHSQTLLASAQVAWLASEGKAQGWRLVGSKVEAQSLANEGYAVIAEFRCRDLTRPGHAAIVRPGSRPRPSIEADGPDVAMAGRHNQHRIPLREAFRGDQVAAGEGEVLLFAHESPVTGAAHLDARLAGKPFNNAVHEVARVVKATAAAVAPGSLAQVMAAALPHWVTAGRVERAHLEALAADPRIKGEQAVALATLLEHLEDGKTSSFAADKFESFAARSHLDQKYGRLVKRLPEIRRTLFVDGTPHFDRIGQGAIGDCYLISGLGWVARFHPRRIVEMIQPLQNGRFEVHFPSGEHAIVEPPTDTEILFAESKGSLQDGLWVAVIEKAVGHLDASLSSKEHVVADPTIRIGFGGSTRKDVHRWTGHAVDVFELKTAEHSKVRRALQEMERHRLMAQAVVSEKDPHPPIPMGHAYAVLGFNPTTEVVTVWNPWGDEFTPKGPAGLKNGWPRKHGVFAVPFRDFVQVFDYIDIEHR